GGGRGGAPRRLVVRRRLAADARGQALGRHGRGHGLGAMELLAAHGAAPAAPLRTLLARIAHRRGPGTGGAPRSLGESGAPALALRSGARPDLSAPGRAVLPLVRRAVRDRRALRPRGRPGPREGRATPPSPPGRRARRPPGPRPGPADPDPRRAPDPRLRMALAVRGVRAGRPLAARAHAGRQLGRLSRGRRPGLYRRT